MSKRTGTTKAQDERELMRVLLEGAVSFTQHKKYRAVPCSSLGTYWRDIEDEDGNLFAMQVPAEIAEAFAADPWKYGNVFAWIPMLRAWALSNEHKYLYGKTEQPPAPAL